eukprot:s4468_g7.t1
MVDPVLPFLKGMALERLKCTEQAANHLEESIAMKPGFRQAHLEFQQAASELDDVERCRRVAQLLVDHGGYWVNCLQRPLHFASNPKVRSQPWYDPQLFELVHALEKNFDAIRGELEAFNSKSVRWSSVGSAHRGNENSRHDADLVSAGEWREVVLLGDSDECQENCRECPLTAELLQSFSEGPMAAVYGGSYKGGVALRDIPTCFKTCRKVPLKFETLKRQAFVCRWHGSMEHQDGCSFGNH